MGKALATKEQRMAKAAKLKHGEGLEYSEIAKRIGVKPQTVRTYFSSDRMEEFERIFSDKEKFELQRMLEQQIYDIEKEAKEKIRQGANHPEASASDRIRAGKELLNIPSKKIKMLQELGVIQKPKERKEVEQKNQGESEVVERLREAYKDELEQEEQEEVEAS